MTHTAAEGMKPNGRQLDRTELITVLEKEMLEAAETLDFERAARLHDRITGATYNLGYRLLKWRPDMRQSRQAVRTARELLASMTYRAACHEWRHLTGQRCSVMNFWRMVEGAGQRLVRQEGEGVGENRKEDPPPRAVRRVYLEADGVWLRRQKTRRVRQPGESPQGGVATAPINVA